MNDFQRLFGNDPVPEEDAPISHLAGIGLESFKDNYVPTLALTEDLDLECMEIDTSAFEMVDSVEQVYDHCLSHTAGLIDYLEDRGANASAHEVQLCVSSARSTVNLVGASVSLSETGLESADTDPDLFREIGLEGLVDTVKKILMGIADAIVAGVSKIGSIVANMFSTLTRVKKRALATVDVAQSIKNPVSGNLKLPNSYFALANPSGKINHADLPGFVKTVSTIARDKGARTTLKAAQNLIKIATRGIAGNSQLGSLTAAEVSNNKVVKSLVQQIGATETVDSGEYKRFGVSTKTHSVVKTPKMLGGMQIGIATPNSDKHTAKYVTFTDKPGKDVIYEPVILSPDQIARTCGDIANLCDVGKVVETEIKEDNRVASEYASMLKEAVGTFKRSASGDKTKSLLGYAKAIARTSREYSRMVTAPRRTAVQLASNVSKGYLNYALLSVKEHNKG